MRISVVNRWLLATLSLAIPSASQEAGSAGGVFTFDPYQGFTERTAASGIPGKPAVITTQQNGVPFRWNILDHAKLNAVTLYSTPTAEKADITKGSKLLASKHLANNGTPPMPVRVESNPSASTTAAETAETLGLTGK